MTGFVRTAFLCLIVGGVSWSVGVRVHPLILLNYIPVMSSEENLKKPYRKVDFDHGRSFMIGKVVDESEDFIVLRVPSGKVHYSKSEIRRITPLDHKDMKSKRYHTGVNRVSSSSFITHRKEDSIIHTMQKKVEDHILPLLPSKDEVGDILSILKLKNGLRNGELSEEEIKKIAGRLIKNVSSQ